MADYLHGTEIVETTKPVVVTEGSSSVIGLVGTAPIGAVNIPTLITSITAARSTFGQDVGGFTIPAALEVIFNSVSAKVIVVNVLENEDAAALLEEDGKMTLDDDDYWITGIGKATLPVTADYASNVILGIEKLISAAQKTGYKPNVIIAPGYSQLPSVFAKMDAVRTKLNAQAYVDATADTVAAALTARASGAYATASSGLVLCFPRQMRYNAHEKASQPCALSVWYATAKVITDAKYGYWISPSNTEFTDILESEIEITASLTDSSADTNLLNGKGICTVFSNESGKRTWGNWTAAFPTESTCDVMIAPFNVRMMIREAIVRASLKYLDKTNINRIGIDMILNSVNAFIRTLVGKGALNAGSECQFVKDDNPSTEIAQGHLTFTLVQVYAPSLDKLTFKEVVDLDALTF